jgi:hypothetical protein
MATTGGRGVVVLEGLPKKLATIGIDIIIPNNFDNPS